MKNENGFLSLLTQAVEKGSKIPSEIHSVSVAVKSLSTELVRLSQTVFQLAQMVKSQDEAINHLIAVQNFVLKKMSNENFDTEDFDMPLSKKEKSQKLN